MTARGLLREGLRQALKADDLQVPVATKYQRGGIDLMNCCRSLLSACHASQLWVQVIDSQQQQRGNFHK